MSSQTPKQPLDEASLEEVTGGTSTSLSTAASQLNIQGMDIESALMAVQASRAGIIEDQLRDQIAAVQARNEMIDDLNIALSSANKLSALLQSNTTNAADPKLSQAVGELLEAVKGLDVEKDLGAILEDGKITKTEMSGLITGIKGALDGLSNTSQMDMLRLQALSEKRNEAFDTMTQFVKKMQESRANIIGNMR